jgi:signal transduction histidine kinase
MNHAPLSEPGPSTRIPAAGREGPTEEAARLDITSPKSGRASLRRSDLEVVRQAATLNDLLAAIATSAARLVAQNASSFLVLRDPVSGEFNARLSASAGEAVAELKVQISLHRHPDSMEKLSRGCPVVMESPAQPAGLRRSRIYLVPVLYDGQVIAILCVTVVPEPAPLSECSSGGAAERDLELLGLLCREAAAPLELLRARHPRRPDPPAGADDCYAVRAGVPGPAEHELRAHLLANIAHELRTPLTSIRGYTKMILEERAGPVTGTQREYLTVVAGNIARLVNITSNLLRLNSMGPLELELLDVRDVIRGSMERMRGEAGTQSLRFTASVPDEPFVTAGDAGMLGQAFDRLLRHTAAQSRPGSEVLIALSRGRNGAIGVRIAIAQLGVPIELCGSLYDWYASPTAEAGDSAASLALAHDIVYLHGGRISVESKCGEGVSVALTLPAIGG